MPSAMESPATGRPGRFAAPILEPYVFRVESGAADPLSAAPRFDPEKGMGSTTRSTGAPVIAGRMVIARFRDGKVLKGTTQDFAPNRSSFHVYVGGDEKSKAVEVQLDQLKAVLYVKDFKGNRYRQDKNSFEQAVGHGRKARVKFSDGEVVAGFTMGYHADRPGFFLVPADPDSNNERIYVLNAAVKSVDWVR
jgi:hypothetical protein